MNATLRENRYGHFSGDGREYVITDPRTPRPWVNVISNPRLGLVVSHTGSGFTFVDNSQLGVITRWQQELVEDCSGKALYLRDAADGSVWSASPAPIWAADARHTCRHGLGFTTFESKRDGIDCRWTLLAHADHTAELWLVELTNHSGRGRLLELVAYLEWNCGVAPAPRREFQKLFMETSYEPAARAVLARSHMWEVGSERWGHWNTDFPYVAAFACSEPPSAVEGDKLEFLGRYRSLRDPAALAASTWAGRFGRHGDPIAAMRLAVELPAGSSKAVAFALAVGCSASEALELTRELASPGAVRTAIEHVRHSWQERLAAHRVAGPDPALDALVNDWVRYQAISARLWGRCGYYQQSGAYGFRDQLQDSQVWLTIEPERCREQIGLHAAHQFADGSVYHWWHPLSEQGHVTRMTDDLLWLAFVTASYLKETGDLAILNDLAPFLDDEKPAPLLEHCERAFARVFGRTSARGLPYIGAGDWNDGLSAVGLEGRGESVWLGQFLAGLLRDWAEVHRRRGDAARAGDCDRRRAELIAVINRHGWDGAWYLRGTLDGGTLLGSSSNAEGRIFLNAQTWAVLADVAPPERAAACMAAVAEHLADDAGALLLAPAYTIPRQDIGYITRYAPGLRENGGVYSHAAVWAIAAAAKVRDAELMARLLHAMDPTGKDPERYWAEPYVLPGNVDGPASPWHGRGGWTWYTGSAAWLHRVVCEWVLGVRPEWDGLVVDPCLPPGWPGARMTRPFRGATYSIEIERAAGLPAGVWTELELDGKGVAGTLIPLPRAAGEHHLVLARCR
ncbi:MAG: glycosyl transferase family 36 [Holophagae bacterium]|nr:MAG: glycosyl transferase family 36 [Holophagae bacterium]